jgi:hypothetical protein
MAWWIPAAVAGAGLISSFMSSKSQSDASKDAADAQLQAMMANLGFQREQWEYMKQLSQPYYDVGLRGLEQATGPEQMQDIQTTINRLNALRDPLYGTGSYPVEQSPYPLIGEAQRQDPAFWEPPPAPAAAEPQRNWIPAQFERKFVETGGFDRGTGRPAGRWVNQQIAGTGVWKEAPAAAAATPKTPAPGPAPAPFRLHTPTTPTNQLAYRALPSQDDPVIPEVLEREEVDPFTASLDEESPYYKFQQELGERALNRAMAARGKFDSSTAINALSDFNRALGAEETERQYGRRKEAYGRRVEDYMRRYGRIMDEYGLRNQAYQRLLDQIRMGELAAGQQQLGATQTGQQVGNIYGQIGRAGAAGQLGQGQAWGQFWGGAAALPMNALSQYYMMQALQPPAQTQQYGATVPTNPNQLPYYNY